MRFSRLKITNFRNFRDLDVELGPDLVLVGENGVGKSNLIYALRLLIDPTLPDASRQLKDEDFWDGLPRPLKAADRISISVDLVDFDKDEDQLAVTQRSSREPRTGHGWPDICFSEGGESKGRPQEGVRLRICLLWW